MALIEKLDPSSLILVLFGFGAWKLANVAMGKFSEQSEKMTESLESIAKDTTMLRVDMAVIANRVNSHETRLDRLETRE
jgi:cobalamin biosynthesis protein CbiD